MFKKRQYRFPKSVFSPEYIEGKNNEKKCEYYAQYPRCPVKRFLYKVVH